MARTQRGQTRKQRGQKGHEKRGGRWVGEETAQSTTGEAQTREAAGAEAAQDGQARIPQANPEYGRSRSNLDQPLKEAIEGEALRIGGSKFHTLGAMDFIDLLSE